MRITIFPNEKAAQHRSAFLLPEVVMAVGVSSFLYVTLYLGIAQGMVGVQNCREDLRATQILEEKMETMRLYSWDQINQAGFIPTNFTAYYYPPGTSGTQGVLYQGTMAINDSAITETYSGDMKLVVGTVTWTSGGVQHQRQIRTFISQFGLQNYVYPLFKP